MLTSSFDKKMLSRITKTCFVYEKVQTNKQNDTSCIWKIHKIKPTYQYAANPFNFLYQIYVLQKILLCATFHLNLSNLVCIQSILRFYENYRTGTISTCVCQFKYITNP